MSRDNRKTVLDSMLSGALRALCVVPPTDEQLREVLGRWLALCRAQLSRDHNEQVIAAWSSSCLLGVVGLMRRDPDPAVEALVKRLDPIFRAVSAQTARGMQFEGEWRANRNK
jgi:hypothetical protein